MQKAFDNTDLSHLSEKMDSSGFSDNLDVRQFSEDIGHDASQEMPNQVHFSQYLYLQFDLNGI